jgi:hypothetical protein
MCFVSVCAVLGLERPHLSFREGPFRANRFKQAAIPRDRLKEGNLGDAGLLSTFDRFSEGTGLTRTGLPREDFVGCRIWKQARSMMSFGPAANSGLIPRHKARRMLWITA